MSLLRSLQIALRNIQRMSLMREMAPITTAESAALICSSEEAFNTRRTT